MADAMSFPLLPASNADLDAELRQPTCSYEGQDPRVSETPALMSLSH